MTERRTDDVRFAAALRAVVPGNPPSGATERLGTALRSTQQRGQLPAPLAPLFDADPAGRRLALLAAAMLLLGVARAGAVATGALRLWGPPTPDITIKPPPDLQAYMVSITQDSPIVRPMAFAFVDDQYERWSGEIADQPVMQRVYLDETGAVRIERFSSVDSTEPDSIMIVTPDRRVELTRQGAEPVWAEEVGPQSPREWIQTRAYLGVAERGCEMAELDPSTNWQYVGLEEILGRPVHHLRCDGDFWIDVETRLVMRSIHTEQTTRTVEVTALELAPQADSLFDTTAPQGIRKVTIDEQRAFEVREYEARMCASDPVCSAPEAALVTPPPAAGEPVPVDINALVARARAAQLGLPPVRVTVSRWRSRGGDAGQVHLDYDSLTRYRIDWGPDPVSGITGSSGIVASAEEIYRSEAADDGTETWHAVAGSRNLRLARDVWLWDALLNRLPEECLIGWRHLGVDLVGPFTADRVTCDSDEYWIDRDSGLVVRLQSGDATDIQISEVVDLTYGRSPDERFGLPDGAVLMPPTIDPNFTPSPAPQPASGG